MNIEEMVKAPFQDPDWIKKSLIMGLLLLIPIVGSFNLLGWMKNAHDRFAAGETTLPEANLDHLGPGWKLFLALLPLMVGIWAFILLFVIGSLIAGAASPELGAIFGGLFMLAYVVVLIGTMVAYPAILYIHIVEGDAWSSMRLGRIKELMMSKGYFFFWGSCFIAYMIGGLGELACGIGLFFTLPLSLAMVGQAMAQQSRVMQSPD